MKKQFLLLCTLAFSSAYFSQTKKIFHRSHSGKPTSFTIFSDGNFGMSSQPVFTEPEKNEARPKLDSVIFVSDSIAIMVTSNMANCRPTAKTSTWKPGRETVYHHPLFSKKHSLDSIKSVLKNTFHFFNNMNDVKFIGYDNKKNIIPKKENKKIHTSIKDKQGQTIKVTVSDTTEGAKKNNEMYIIGSGNSKGNKQNPSQYPLIAVVTLLSLLLLACSWISSPRPSHN